MEDLPVELSVTILDHPVVGLLIFRILPALVIGGLIYLFWKFWRKDK